MHEATGLAALGIDWKILIAQLINFAIIYWLLKKFAFGPIIKVLEERKKRIDASIDAANKIEQQEVKAKGEIAQMLQKAKEEAQTIIDASRKAAKTQELAALKQAEERANKLLAGAKSEITDTKANIMADLAKEIGGLVTQLTQKIVDGNVPQSAKNNINKWVKDRAIK